MKKNRILLVSHEMTYTGAPKSLLMVADVLRNLKYEIEIWTLKGGEFIQEFMKHGYSVRDVCFSESVLDELAGEIEEYMIVIANTVFCAAFAQFAQQFTTTILYLREAQNLPQLIFECKLNSENIRNAEHVICVSEYAQEFIQREYAPRDLKVIHNFMEDIGDVKFAENKNGFIDFLVSGTIEPRKGQLIAQKAYKKLPMELKRKSRLHFVGRLPEWSKEYQEEIELHGQSEIIYRGAINDRVRLMRLYQDMDVILIPSTDEACSLVVLEAAMLGKNIILTENVGAKYLVDKIGLYRSMIVKRLCIRWKNLFVILNY